MDTNGTMEIIVDVRLVNDSSQSDGRLPSDCFAKRGDTIARYKTKYRWSSYIVLRFSIMVNIHAGRKESVEWKCDVMDGG